MPVKIKKMVFLFLFFAVTSVGFADNSPLLQKAIDQYFANEIDAAHDTFIDLSRQNNAEAYYYLGLIYSDKRFKYFEPKSALAYLMSAADLGHAQAMRKIGSMYDNGVGVEQNSLIALDWYRKAKQAEKPAVHGAVFMEDNASAMKEVTYPQVFAKLLKQAENGDAASQYQVAVNFDTGKLIPQDFDKALKWYRRAAKNSHEESQFLLGYFYCRGLGVAKDVNLANEWLRKSGRNARCPP
jgi:TPR repeat protein